MKLKDIQNIRPVKVVGNWKRTILNKLYFYRFEILLFSLASIFVINIFFPKNILGGDVQSLHLIIFVLSGVNLFYKERQWIYKTVSTIGGILLVGNMTNLLSGFDFSAYLPFLYIVFFAWVLVEVIRQIYKAQIINSKMIFAAVSVLLLIGYMGFLLFSAIENNEPNSFAGLNVGTNPSNNLFYFSYITMMTIGYGDVTPVTWAAKNAAMSIGLLGYVYSIFVVAIIISRFNVNGTDMDIKS